MKSSSALRAKTATIEFVHVSPGVRIPLFVFLRLGKRFAKVSYVLSVLI
jgi:hypothetical protein